MVNRYHCDIKIDNALVAKDLVSGTFCVKLCDFTRLCHSVCLSLPPPLTLSTPHRHQLGGALVWQEDGYVTNPAIMPPYHAPEARAAG